MKKIIKKLLLITIILMLLFSISTKVYALDEIISAGKGFLNRGSGSEISQGEMQDLSSFLYWTLLAAGVVIAVIIATVLGIQFMVGGAEGQAKVKELIIPFIVGCVVVFGGFGFWKIATTIDTRINSGSTYIVMEDNIRIV